MPAEMTDSPNQSAQQDESAVAAVRGGDAERYRELVERHERRVYAVAWSRLGDAALAEEVTQEAFIRAYRRLWLLGDGAKFSGWVSTIARRVAINFGLRHRRELNKRERWALENFDAATEANSADENDPPHSPETLRQTLAELPAGHRECLVLFYLEGKSGAEAAAALGISEAALRVRLHRARAAMRERLEEKLEGSLAKLRPAKTLVAAVMAGVLASSSAKAATAGGLGATILGTLAKFTPFKWLFTFFAFLPLLLPVVMILPALFFQRWQRRDEQRNYRDAKGFRAGLHRQFDQSYLVFFAFLIGMTFVFFATATHPFGFETKDLFLGIGLFTLVAAGFAGRLLEINCSRFQIGFLFCNLFMSGFYLCIGLGRLPIAAVFPAIIVSTLFTIFANPNRSRPLRMDYNLFLRATQGMLPPAGSMLLKESSIRFNRSALRAFARFLGERQMANNFHWGGDGLTLFLPAVKSPLTTTWNRIFPTVKNNSSLTLGWDGAVVARCGIKDAAGWEALRNNFTSDLIQLENQVALAVALAWQNFREKKIAAAERAIGQIPDAEIFVVPPGRTRANRWQRIVAGGLLTVSMILLAAGWLFQETLSGLKSVNLTEAQVREFMSLVSTNPNPLVPKILIGGEKGYTQKGFAWDPHDALFGCLVLPEKNLFTPRGLQAMYSTILGSDDLEKWRQNSKRLQLFVNSQYHRAIYEGWVSWPELNLQPADCEAFLHTNRSLIYSGAFLGTNWDRFLSRCDAWSWVKSQHYDVMRIQNWGVWDLRFLSEVNSLDLVDREKLIQQIASVQTLSAIPPGNPPIHDWRDVRGLFFTPCFPALQDTYLSLAALEVLGGLDKIDRAACIEGILKRHQGKGFFTSPSSGSYNEYHIDGSARDTIAAFESLRILGALDRVKDLDKWQFRPLRRGVAKNELTWYDIEAWVCQQRLEKILRERKKNPSVPVHSLLEP